MTRKTPSLDAAYALRTPDDNRALYADWAATYDADFAARTGYRLPQMVALILAERAPAGPVLDVGAGTGLIADAFPLRGAIAMHALDISGDMLAVAMAKGHYAKAIEADLTQPLALADGVYGGIVSSGTFTHGHVGPDALDELLRIARPGAEFVLTINAAHFEARGFAAKFDALAGRITAPELREVPIYTAGDGGHAADTAQIATFSKI